MIQKTLRNKTCLVKKLVKLDYSNDKNITKHLNTFMRILDMKIDDKLQIILILSPLPKSWDTLIVTFNNSRLNEKLSMNLVTNIMLNEKLRQRKLKATC
ncbi:hypothetical protein CR513_08202, partial [Mucuna pruriens]